MPVLATTPDRAETSTWVRPMHDLTRLEVLQLLLCNFRTGTRLRLGNFAPRESTVGPRDSVLQQDKTHCRHASDPGYGTVRLESINLLTLRALPDFRWGGRNGNDDRSYLSREFRSRITSFGTLTVAVANLAAPADPRPQGRLRGAQTGQKRAKTRVKEIDLPKKAFLAF